TDGQGGKVVHGYFLPVFTTLTLDSPVTIAGASFSIGYAGITVPPGLTAFQITTRGDAGDADLIVRGPGATNVSQHYTASNETITYATPFPGDYQIEVHGKYADVSLLASAVTPTLIEPDSTLTPLSGVEGS